MTVKMAESDADLERISGVLLQLRNAFDRETLIAQIKQQREAGYRIAYVESDGEILCVAGFIVGSQVGLGEAHLRRRPGNDRAPPVQRSRRENDLVA